MVFCGLLLKEFIFRQEIEMDAVSRSFEFDLDAQEKAYILALLKMLSE